MPVIETLVGFSGVIITLWYNAYQARKQQERQWQHEQKKAAAEEANERAALRAALIAELQEIRLSIQVLLEYDKERKKEILLPPVPVDAELNTAIYRAVLPRITVLSAPEISALISAYTGFIRNIGNRTGLENIDNRELYIRRADLYLHWVKIISENIELALKVLEEHKETE